MSQKLVTSETSTKDIIEVYRTNILSSEQSERLKDRITEIYPDVKVSFDLEDSDKILRIKGNFDPVIICEIASVLHIFTQILD